MHAIRLMCTEFSICSVLNIYSQAEGELTDGPYQGSHLTMMSRNEETHKSVISKR